MIKPKGEGGMGFKDLKLFNQALLARKAWRLFLFPDSLCAQVLKAKYFPDGHLPDTVPAGNASQTWRAIEHGLELLKRGVIWRVGDGASLRIWRDNWIPRPLGMRPIGTTRACRLRRVEHLIDQEGRAWDETLLRRYFYPCDVAEIMKIKIPWSRCADWLAWNFEKSGMFTVKSAYRLAFQLKHGSDRTESSSRPEGGRRLWKNIWSAHVPSKVRVFAWKVVRNGLPTRANKHRRHLESQSDCELCGWAREDVFHAVVACPHAKGLRDAMRAHWSLPREEEIINTGPDWLILILERYDDQTRANFLMVLWRCWNMRNGVLKAGENISIKGSVAFLSRYLLSLNQI